MTTQLLKPGELDIRLRYPSGRSLRLARQGLIPSVTLPDGEVRFDPTVIESWLTGRSAGAPGTACLVTQPDPIENERETRT